MINVMSVIKIKSLQYNLNENNNEQLDLEANRNCKQSHLKDYIQPPVIA